MAWMEWKIGSKLRTKEEITSYYNHVYTHIEAGKCLTLTQVKARYICATTAPGQEHMIDGSDCCYLEVVQEPKQNRNLLVTERKG